jgi:tetratricopeptide (TPR) repeat protein
MAAPGFIRTGGARRWRARLTPRLGWLPALLGAGAALLAAFAGLSLAAAPAAAQTAPQPRIDRVELTSVTMDALAPPGPIGSAQLRVSVNYQLRTARGGFLLLYLFEDDATTSTQDNDGGVKVSAGSGYINLEGVYSPGTDVRALTVLVALFRDDNTLLSWASTTPMSLEPLPGRTAFAQAMAARLAGDYGQAVEHLNQAIQVSPQTGQYYYWRAASEVRLGRHDVAIADYTRAIELMPQDRPSRVGRGVALLWKEQWELALSDLTQVVDGTPTPDQETAWAHRARGTANAALGHASAAIADYQQYLALMPDAPDRDEVASWIPELQALSAS